MTQRNEPISIQRTTIGRTPAGLPRTCRVLRMRSHSSRAVQVLSRLRS
jgi:hypothetical protein